MCYQLFLCPMQSPEVLKFLKRGTNSKSLFHQETPYPKLLYEFYVCSLLKINKFIFQEIAEANSQGSSPKSGGRANSSTMARGVRTVQGRESPPGPLRSTHRDSPTAPGTCVSSRDLCQHRPRLSDTRALPHPAPGVPQHPVSPFPSPPECPGSTGAIPGCSLASCQSPSASACHRNTTALFLFLHCYM